MPPAVLRAPQLGPVLSVPGSLLGHLFCVTLGFISFLAMWFSVSSPCHPYPVSLSVCSPAPVRQALVTPGLTSRLTLPFSLQPALPGSLEEPTAAGSVCPPASG